jgi:tetratricopeptide (TPR) repeat protein
MCEHELAMAYYGAKQHAEAIPLLEKALSWDEGRAGSDRLFTWHIRHSLGWSYLNTGRRDQAIAAFEKNLAIVESSVDVLTMQALAWALRDKDVDRSLSLYKQARALRAERGIPDDAAALSKAREELGVLRSAGRIDEALALIDETISRTEKALGADHLNVHKARLEKARFLGMLKQYQPSDAVFRDTLARLEKLRGPNDTEVLAGMHLWMLAVRDRGWLFQAAEIAGDLAARRRGAEGSESIGLAGDLLDQGSNFVNAGRPADGEPALREAVAIYTKKTPQAWNAANAKSWLGIALHNQQKIAEAEPLLLAAFAEMTERIGATPAWGQNRRRYIVERLIALYTAQSKSDETAKWQQQLDALTTTSKE